MTTRPKGPAHRPHFVAKPKAKKHQIDKKPKGRQQPPSHNQHKDKRRTPSEERGLPTYARRKLHEKPKEAETLITMPRHKVVRKWEVHPGKNTFCCDGRLLMAKQAGIFYLTIAIVLITSAMSFIGDMPFLATEVSPIIPVIGAVLFIFTFSNLFKTSFSDPGIIPRATKAEAWDLEHQIELQTNSNGNAYRPPPRSKDVQVKNQTIKLKYCFTCKIFRPPRASHCSVCDNCVEHFDHHCPWVGNCIGKRNYRYFYFFLVSIAFYCVFIFACALTHLLLEARGDGQRSGNFIDAIRKSPSSIICIVITFFSVWSILGLTGFHTYLTSSNLTTNEDLKGSFSSKRNHDNFNPYSNGNACSNCFSVLCGPMPPSLIDPHGKVTEEFVREYGITIPGMPGSGEKPRRAKTNGQATQTSYGAAGNERTAPRSSDRSDSVVASKQEPVTLATAAAAENGDLDQTTMIGSALDLDDVDSGEPNDADAVNSQASAPASHAGSQVGLLKLSAV